MGSVFDGKLLQARPAGASGRVCCSSGVGTATPGFSSLRPRVEYSASPVGSLGDQQS